MLFYTGGREGYTQYIPYTRTNRPGGGERNNCKLLYKKEALKKYEYYDIVPKKVVLNCRDSPIPAERTVKS